MGREWPGSLEDRTGALGGFRKAEGTQRGELSDLERSQRPWGEIFDVLLESRGNPQKGFKWERKSQNFSSGGSL